MHEAIGHARTSNWRDGGVGIGDIVQLGEGFETRLGHCWARGRLREGDLLMAVEHAGDCFFRYVLLDHHGIMVAGKMDHLQLEPVRAPFGAYHLGHAIVSLNADEVAEMMKDGSRMIDIPAGYVPQKPLWE